MLPNSRLLARVTQRIEPALYAGPGSRPLISAVSSERLTVDAAAGFANFVARSRYDRALHIEWKKK